MCVSFEIDWTRETTQLLFEPFCCFEWNFWKLSLIQIYNDIIAFEKMKRGRFCCFARHCDHIIWIIQKGLAGKGAAEFVFLFFVFCNEDTAAVFCVSLLGWCCIYKSQCRQNLEVFSPYRSGIDIKSHSIGICCFPISLGKSDTLTLSGTKKT